MKNSHHVASESQVSSYIQLALKPFQIQMKLDTSRDRTDIPHKFSGGEVSGEILLDTLDHVNLLLFVAELVELNSNGPRTTALMLVKPSR